MLRASSTGCYIILFWFAVLLWFCLFVFFGFFLSRILSINVVNYNFKITFCHILSRGTYCTVQARPCIATWMLPLAAGYSDNCWVGVRPLVNLQPSKTTKYVKTCSSGACSWNTTLILALLFVWTWTPLAEVRCSWSSTVELRMCAEAWVGVWFHESVDGAFFPNCSLSGG